MMYLDLVMLNSGQQELVKAAAESIRQQTHGCVQFEYGIGVPVLPMVPESKYDLKMGASVMGLWDPEFKTIELAFGRLRDRDTVLVVSAHELLHSLGLRHVTANPNSLMFTSVNSSHLSMSQEDGKELFRATGCRL